ncbi:unnamed protein product [Cylindrotheca closterium]|uniref:VOC domain-containing protein n=1 Tax=Cylindrotheca closterium TaxID=2856 RepID=A0AAD2G8L7_9STRA|nr:unnamed protein product [Cylindrotheca closterium]
MTVSKQSRSPRNRRGISFCCSALSLICFFHSHKHYALAFSARRPFQLQHLDHIVLTFPEDINPMMEFYTEILGCTIDSPEDIGRLNGRLTHLRAGPNTMIDLMKRDDDEDSDDATDNDDEGHRSSPSSSSAAAVDHFCLRIDPYDQGELEDYLQSKGIEIQSSGMRKGAEGVGPSIYIQDPEGNTVELKGPAMEKQSNDENQKEEKGTPSHNIHEPTATATTRPKDDYHDDSDQTKVPVTPCTRICRYNADFFGGQVCIGCFREGFEVGTWASMSPFEKYMGLLDAIDRCNESSIPLDGAISLEELQRQADYWKNLSLAEG